MVNRSLLRMNFKSRGWIIQMIIGLPCAALGIAQIHSGITDRLGVEFVLILVGLFFTLLGIAVAFTRRGVVIDKRSGMAIQWIGLMIPMYKATTPLSNFEKVSLTKKIIKGDRHTTTVYPVSLVGNDSGL